MATIEDNTSLEYFPGWNTNLAKQWCQSDTTTILSITAITNVKKTEREEMISQISLKEKEIEDLRLKVNELETDISNHSDEIKKQNSFANRDPKPACFEFQKMLTVSLEEKKLEGNCQSQTNSQYIGIENVNNLVWKTFDSWFADCATNAWFDVRVGDTVVYPDVDSSDKSRSYQQDQIAYIIKESVTELSDMPTHAEIVKYIKEGSQAEVYDDSTDEWKIATFKELLVPSQSNTNSLENSLDGNNERNGDFIEAYLIHQHKKIQLCLHDHQSFANLNSHRFSNSGFASIDDPLWILRNGECVFRLPNRKIIQRFPQSLDLIPVRALAEMLHITTETVEMFAKYFFRINESTLQKELDVDCQCDPFCDDRVITQNP